jgi:hypothetical protein
MGKDHEKCDIFVTAKLRRIFFSRVGKMLDTALKFARIGTSSAMKS